MDGMDGEEKKWRKVAPQLSRKKKVFSPPVFLVCFKLVSKKNISKKQNPNISLFFLSLLLLRFNMCIDTRIMR